MSITEVLASLFIVMIAGFVAGKSKLFDESSRRDLSKFVFYIATSALIIESIASLKLSDLDKLPRFITVNTLFYAAIFVALFLVLKLLGVTYKKGASILYAGTVANTIYLGLPVVRTLYGSEGVLFAVALFTIPSALSDIVDFYVLGSWRKKHGSVTTVLKDFLTNPLVVSTCIGVLLLVACVHLPQSLNASLNLLGSGATGLALFAMGLFLSASSWRQFKFKQASIATIIKLVVVPLLALYVGRAFGLSGTALSVMVLMAAMPSAIFCMVVATEYDFDERATADTILLSSVGFIVSSWFWIHILS